MEESLEKTLRDAGYDRTQFIEGCDDAFVGITHDDAALYDNALLKDNMDINLSDNNSEYIAPVFFNRCDQIPDGVVVLDPRELDRAVIGITDDNRAVYDYDLLIDAFMESEGWTEEEAIDWCSYNTIRSLPYVENSPIIVTNLDYMF